MTSKPLVIRRRIGWLGLALAPMLLTGAAAIYVGVSIEFTGTMEAKPGAGWAVLVLGLFTMLFSVSALSMRWDLEIDRSAGQVRRTRGILGMNRSYAYDLALFDKVVVTHPRVQSADRAPSSYHVLLTGVGITVRLAEYSNREAAAGKASEVAAYLELPTELAREG